MVVAAAGGAVVDAAAVDAAAAGAARETSMTKGHCTMRSILLPFTAVLALVTTPGAWAEPAKTFASPEEAVAALLAALEANDDKAMLVIFGSDAADLVQQGSDPLVAASRKDIATQAGKKLSVEGAEGGTAVIEVGDQGWPLPIPLVKDGAGWRFDAAAGRTELLARRIGRNELLAIALAGDYLDTQIAYASVDRDGDGVREYAQRLVSTPGQQDGLYWEPTADGGESPLGVELDDAAAPNPGAPYGGYMWKILTAQGPNAPGGAYSYVINGNMIAGFALVGTPAEYRQTGVMTFIVSSNGKIYQKDLGSKGLDVAKGMTAFDPDASWTLIEVEDEGDDVGLGG
jgi:hypothetical protein